MTEENQTTGIPRIGDTAPDFTAVTTQGEINFHEWGGSDWVVLFSHPADFTPVCSTELTEFARRKQKFADKNTKLLGLSIDSIHSHLAWRENLAERCEAVCAESDSAPVPARPRMEQTPER